MLNYYQLLNLAPTASRSDIEAALDKQQALGTLPPATLKLVADVLLSVENRQLYDEKLSTLPEMNQEYALASEELALSHSPNAPTTPSSQQLPYQEPPRRAAVDETADEDAVLVYPPIRQPDAHSRTFSMAKVKHTIMTSPMIWLLFAVLIFKLVGMATQETDFDVAEQHCIAAIQQQLAYPDSLHINTEEEVERPWRHRRVEYPVTIDYSAQPVFNQTQNYRAECVYNSDTKSLSDIKISAL